MARKSRVEAAADNRAAVLKAAREHFEAHGFHGASLDAIAESAGFSKGVVYSHFDGKDDLFLAVMADHVEQRRQALEVQLAGATAPDDLHLLVDASIMASVTTVAWQAALLEFRAHAWRHSEINTRYAAMHEQTIEVVSRHFADLFRRGGVEPPMETESMAQLGLLVGTGVVAEYMANDQLDVHRLTAAIAVLLQPSETKRTGRR